jgi:hypothetical protein
MDGRDPMRRGWVYHDLFTGAYAWWAAIADGPPGEGEIIHDLGGFDTHADAIAVVCAVLRDGGLSCQ